MSLRVEEIYPNGVPQTIVPGFAPRGIGWHWSAGEDGEAGWDATVRYLILSRTSVNASYHLGFGHNHVADGKCVTWVKWIVRPDRAAHSLAPGLAFVPATGSALEKERFADVHRILERDSDPNADIIAAAYAGMPADLVRDMGCQVFRDDIRTLARQLEQMPSLADGPHFGHGWIQPSTRYEMDAPGVDFISALAPIITSEPPPPPLPTREERLAEEVIALRAQFPAAAEYWRTATQLPYEPREPRLAAEVLFLRLVALNGGRYR